MSLYTELLALTGNKDSFYFTDSEYKNAKYRIFNYRLASYTDFLQPSALECRGVMFLLTDNTGVSLDEPVLVCRPMQKFFNLNENPFTMNLNLSNDNIIRMEMKADGCFPVTASLSLWDGGVISIGKVVNNKLPVTLIGMDDQGNIVPCKVVDWHKNGTKTNWLDLKLAKSGRGRYTTNIRVTSNHHMYINGVWQSADTIKPGDTVKHVTSGIDKSAYHIIQSSLLGDGSISANGNTWRFQEAHSNSQVAYCEWIHAQLGNTAAPVIYESTNSDNRFNNQSIWFVNSKSYSELSKLRQLWYTNDGIKQLPEDISWIDDFTIAKWYMDDGSIRKLTKCSDAAAISTDNFTKDEVERLCELLHQRYSINAVLMATRQGNFSIRINNDNNSIQSFWKTITPYVPSCMRYKIPTEFHNIPYNESLIPKGTECWKHHDVRVLEISQPELTRANFSSGAVGYDISTTTTNYHVSGILVHNSLISSYIDVEGQLALKSKGALLSEQAQASMRILENKPQLKAEIAQLTHQGYTVNMELVAPYNRIVLNYQYEQLVVLNVRDNQTGIMYHRGDFQEEYPNIWCEWIESATDLYKKTHDQLIKDAKDLTDIEGFIVYLKDGTVFKLKTEWYLSLHRSKEQIDTPRRLFEAVINEGTDDLRSLFFDNQWVLDRIDIMERKGIDVYNTVVNSVESFVESNRNLIDNNQRKEYAIKGQQELDKGFFGLAMQHFMLIRGERAEPIDYKAFCIKHWKQWGISDQPESNNE